MVNKKKEVDQIPRRYLQRPYYWSWGGIASNATTNKWPKKEDRLRKTANRAKSIKVVTVSSSDSYDVFDGSESTRATSLFGQEAFVTDFNEKNTADNGHFTFTDVTSVLPTTSTTVDYQIDRKQPKWNFNLTIGDTNYANVTRTSEVYVHNNTVILITGNTFLPKLFNETVDYGGYNIGGNWSNGTDFGSNYTGTVAVVNYDIVHIAAMVATAITLGLIILATVIENQKPENYYGKSSKSKFSPNPKCPEPNGGSSNLSSTIVRQPSLSGPLPGLPQAIYTSVREEQHTTQVTFLPNGLRVVIKPLS